MATVEGQPFKGTITIDLSDVKDQLVDLPPGAMRGLRTEQEGMADVIKELAQAVPAHGDAADVPAQPYARFVAATALLDKLRVHEAELEKALEVVKETRAKAENDREDEISIIVKAVHDTANRKKNPSIAAPFEVTTRYNGQIAEKALQTRKKNAEAKAGADAKTENKDPAPTGGQPPPV